MKDVVKLNEDLKSAEETSRELLALRYENEAEIGDSEILRFCHSEILIFWDSAILRFWNSEACFAGRCLKISESQNLRTST